MHSAYQSHLARNYKRLDSSEQKHLQELKRVKYPVLAIQPAQSLDKKLLQFSKNQKLYNQMKQKLLKEHQLNTYRKIRGDGNCFFRALAYSVLSNVKNLSNVQETFYQLNDIKLTSCHEKSIPKEFRTYYNDEFLKLVLRENWGLDVKNYKSLYKMNNKRILSRLFRKYPYLDFIVILYFRALCLKGLQKHKSQVKQFMKGTEQQEVRTYGQQSQGVTLDICSRYLKISIDVYEVRAQQIKHYSYKKVNFLSLSGSSNQVSLLYYENHYDIIEELSQKQLLEEQSDLRIQQEEYYSTINEKMVEGQCIECGKQTQIFQDHSLCQDCFNISRNQLINTVKSGKLIKGNCRDCGRKNVKVQQMINLCQRCIQKQELAQKSSMKKSVKNTQSSQKSSHIQPQQQQEIDYCLQCDNRSLIDPETKLCFNCKSVQRIILQRQQKRRPKCSDCRQPFDSQFHEFKCVKKLTQAKINMKKMHYDQNKCKDCGQLRITEQLVDGICWKCEKKAKQMRDKVREYNQRQRDQTIKTLGQRVFEQSQRCKNCKRTSYTYKLQNGLCGSCKHYQGSIFKH